MNLRTWTVGQPTHLPPVVLLHGGPGLPDYLGPVAAMLEDLTVVHHYDQRGVGGSQWEGRHTLDLHLEDLDQLLDGWGYERVILVGHSYGTDLAARFCLRSPDRVAGLIFLCGPFLDPWRERESKTRQQRMTEAQRARLGELEATTDRTEQQERELLTLAWFPDHYDQTRAWAWAEAAVGVRRPINWEMNSQIGVARKLTPLEDRIDDLKAAIPKVTVIIGAVGDPRPAAALERLGRQLECPVVIIAEAGHEPWLEQPEVFREELRAAVTSVGPSE